MTDSFLTPQMKDPVYQEAQRAFGDGSVFGASRTTLQRYLLAIAINATGDDAIQARDTAQSATVNHLILQRHIDDLDAKAKFTQWLVIALTVASLGGTVVQSWLAYRADRRSETESARIPLAKTVSKQPAVATPPSAPTIAPANGETPAMPASSPARSAGAR